MQSLGLDDSLVVRPSSLYKRPANSTVSSSSNSTSDALNTSSRVHLAAMVSFTSVISVFAIVSASLATPLVPRSLTSVQNDIATISSKIVAVNSAAIFAASNPSTQVFALATSNAVTAVDTAVKQGITDLNTTIGTFADADCTRAFNVSIPTLITNTMTTEFPELVTAKGALLQWGFTLKVIQSLTTLKTDLHTFIGAFSAKCSPALAPNFATVQANTDAVVQRFISSFP
ncbi:hypothetical protein EXIGLDRAFT_721824 [Exidia glandulosa HHB12029]|uniref:Hydrophobic surface binding protein n=1 Tax=Exidia glandulosa HHB12029 TaxID=1314781 RepID=A0A165QHW9_EXIGL|nr:hypothetical protein EXIGLDRAFT_721824 [Exidia glandulosa HHB12029]